MMRIGEAAHQSGVHAKNIRYYEEIGLIPAAARAPNGYRVYTASAVERLRFIKRSRDLGFSIDEVTELLTLWADDQRASGEVKALALEHVARIEAKIAELKSMRDTVLELAQTCQGDERPECPILDDLAGQPDPQTPSQKKGGPHGSPKRQKTRKKKRSER